MCTPQSNTFLTTAQGKSLPQFPISSEIQLAEVLSLTKNGIITLWVDPHKDPSRVPSGKRGKVLFTNSIKPATFCRTWSSTCRFFLIHCHYRFLKLAKPNCNTALRESEDGDEKRESSYEACYETAKKTQASRIQVMMLGMDDGEENLNSRGSLPVSWGKLID